jgi:hypothetical protein
MLSLIDGKIIILKWYEHAKNVRKKMDKRVMN